MFIVAVMTTVPAPVALACPLDTEAPAAVLPEPRLHTMVLFVAFAGATVPVSVTGVPTVPEVGTLDMPVTGFIIPTSTDIDAPVALCTLIMTLLDTF